MLKQINLEEIENAIKEIVELEFIDFNEDQISVQFKPLNPVEVYKAKSAIKQTLMKLGYNVIESRVGGSLSQLEVRCNLRNILWFTIK